MLKVKIIKFQKIQFFNLVRYVFNFFQMKIRKRLILYEIKELSYFLLRIFKNNCFCINIWKTTHNASFFFNEILNFVLNCSDEIFWFSPKKSQYLRYLNYYFSKKIKFSTSILLQYKCFISENFFRNFILFIRNWILKSNYNRIRVNLVINQNKNFNWSHFYFTKFFFSSLYLSCKLLKKVSQAITWKIFFRKNEIKTLFKFLIQKIFFFEDFIVFFAIFSLKKRIFDIKKFVYNFFFDVLKIIKISTFKLFKARKFLVDINKFKKLKNLLINENIHLFVQKNNKLKFFPLNFGKIKLVFLTNFRGNNSIIKLFQRNLLSLFELERLKMKLSSFFLLKVFIVHLKSLKSVNKYSLFLFNILNILYHLKNKILRILSGIEKKFEKNLYKLSLVFQGFKRSFLEFNKILFFNKILDFKNENVHFAFLKLIRIIIKLNKKLSARSKAIKKYNNLYLIRIKSIPEIKHCERRLENLNDWQNIFENRLSYFFYSIIDFDNHEFKNGLELNDYNFRRIGF
jgi:hypothetical protein